jgi:hypothetical protein
MPRRSILERLAKMSHNDLASQVGYRCLKDSSDHLCIVFDVLIELKRVCRARRRVVIRGRHHFAGHAVQLPVRHCESSHNVAI